MMSADTIRSLFVGKLKDIASLVTLVDYESNIIEYIEEDRGDLFTAINNLRPNQILVAYQGTDPSGERGLWLHHFSIIFRPGGSPSAIFKAIIDGIPTGESLNLFRLPLAVGLHPMDTPSIGRRRIPVGEMTGFDYWEITTAFQENVA